MKHLLILSALILAGVIKLTASAPTDSVMTRRAALAYQNREYPSALAMYSVLAEREPHNTDAYTLAITSAQVLGDSTASTHLLEKAMHAGVGLDSVLEGVRTRTLALGRNELYCRFLLQTRRQMPYMSRAIDARLLDYYVFRCDAPRMVEYAGIMLRGVPDSVTYLRILARGYLDQGITDCALDTYRRILDIAPDDYDALLQTGLILRETDPESARPYLSRANSLRPTPYLTSLLSSPRL